MILQQASRQAELSVTQTLQNNPHLTASSATYITTKANEITKGFKQQSNQITTHENQTATNQTKQQSMRFKQQSNLTEIEGLQTTLDRTKQKPMRIKQQPSQPTYNQRYSNRNPN